MVDKEMSVIQKYGFEHKRTIKFFKLVESHSKFANLYYNLIMR